MEKKLFAPAKLNISLQILGRRPDGYHLLKSLMVPISRGDQITLTTAKQGLEIISNKVEIPTGPDSLLYRTFEWASKKFNYTQGLKIILEKNVPIGAGMGGGSSDAAALIWGMGSLCQQALAETEFPEIATHLGADIPFFLAGGARWVSGIGERIGTRQSLPPLYFILVHPGIHLSTAWAYQAFDQLPDTLTSSRPVASLPPSAGGGLKDLLQITNDLESVVFPQYPALSALKERLEGLEADAALMSGSGSTVFGLFSQKEKRDEALEVLKHEHPDYWIKDAEVF
jgi:4-diphosphocytidyl-2-C-methyl-D-erythritol kinase